MGVEAAPAGAKKAPTNEQLKWATTFAKLDPVGSSAGGGSGGPALPDAMDAVSMDDEDVAAEIADKQIAILEGWQGALSNFGTVMNSASDEEATPKFQKAILAVAGNLLMDEILGAVKDVPGAAELQKFATGFKAEADRAKKAMASATLRDFLVGHGQAITKLKQKVLDGRQGFISALKAKRETLEGMSRSGKPGKPGLAKPSKEADGFGMTRMALMDALAKLDTVRQRSGPETLFRALSEEWVGGAQVHPGMGVTLPAFVLVRLNKDYSVEQAYFQGTGGQKIAEQLLRDSPEGVDVLSLKTKKQITYPGDGRPGTGAIASLDADNHDISNANMGEGHTEAVIKVILAKGTLLARKVKGDS